MSITTRTRLNIIKNSRYIVWNFLQYSSILLSNYRYATKIPDAHYILYLQNLTGVFSFTKNKAAWYNNVEYLSKNSEIDLFSSTICILLLIRSTNIYIGDINHLYFHHFLKNSFKKVNQ